MVTNSNMITSSASSLKSDFTRVANTIRYLSPSLFNGMEHPINEGNAYQVGKKVYPKKALAKHHMTNKCTPERHQPRPTNQLGELHEIRMNQTNKCNKGQAFLDQYDTPKTKDHHGPECITNLIWKPADMSGIESDWNQDNDANQRDQKLSFHLF